MKCKQLVNSYVSWLKEGLRIEQLNPGCVISTPFLDRHNDEIEIYVEKRNDELWLTDDGYTLADLRHSSVVLDTDKRRAHLRGIIQGFGVRNDGEQLCVATTPEDFPQRKHNLIQAILAVNDMFVMGEESVLQLFKEDVEKFLRSKDVPIIRDVKLSGYSGFDHKFDIAVPPRGNRPEGVVQAINRLTKERAASLAFMISDVERERGKGSLIAYAFINDAEDAVNSENLSALTAYGIKPILWSHREKEIVTLTA
ncbi:MAG TPA: DUF1828 domain-containing protein [Verrucomicrobiae bacterium]|jgi:hypothetical protein